MANNQPGHHTKGCSTLDIMQIGAILLGGAVLLIALVIVREALDR